MQANNPRRWTAAFLDRDGTLNVHAPEGDYITRADQLRLLPGSARAVRILNASKIPVVVVTNQRGIALGLMSEDEYEKVTARFRELLAADEAFVDLILHCPHDKNVCDCRKPNVGMLKKAAMTLGFDLSNAFLIGDKPSDTQCADRAGIEGVFVETNLTDLDRVIAELVG